MCEFQGQYVISTFGDVGKFSEIMPVYAGMINSVYKTSWFIFYRNDVKFLLNKIQENIDISMEEVVSDTYFLASVENSLKIWDIA